MRRLMTLGAVLVVALVGTLWLTWPSDDVPEAVAALAPQVEMRRAEAEPLSDWHTDDAPTATRAHPLPAAALAVDEAQPPPSAHLDVVVRSAEGAIAGATVALTQDDADDAAGEPACPCTAGSDLRLSDPACGDCPELVTTILGSVRGGQTFVPLLTGTTNRAGEASIELPQPTPRLSAWIEAPGFTPVSAGPFLPVNLHVEIVLHRPIRDGYRILGPDDRPLPHASAAAFSTHPFRAYAPRRDGDVFWFEGVPAEYVLAATGGEAGLQPAMARAANRAHPDGGTVDDLQLEAGTRLRAVVTRDGNPVPSTPVEIVCNERRIPVATDAHGRFEVWPAPASGCDLLARAQGLIARSDYAPDSAPNSPSFDLSLELAAPGAIEGVVLDAKTGNPQAEVPVLLMSSGDTAHAGQLNGQFVTVDTDASGHFRFDELAAGEFMVLAAITGEGEPVKVASGQHAALTLRVTPADSIY